MCLKCTTHAPMAHITHSIQFKFASHLIFLQQFRLNKLQQKSFKFGFITFKLFSWNTHLASSMHFILAQCLLLSPMKERGHPTVMEHWSWHLSALLQHCKLYESKCQRCITVRCLYHRYSMSSTIMPLCYSTINIVLGWCKPWQCVVYNIAWTINHSI